MKETVILEFQVDEGASIETIESLTKANKALREERKKLNLDTEEGKKRINEINAALDRNNTKIKDNSSAIEKQRANIGNYKSALDGVHPTLGKVGEGLEAGASGFKAMARSALAFIATPIGAVLAALVAVFTLLKTAIATNNNVLDKFENITNAIGIVVDVLVNRVGKLGQALIALAEGNFSEAINLTGQAFGGLAEEINNAVTAGQLYLNLSRDLEDQQRALRIEIARQENEIKRLVVAAKNQSLTLEEQEGFLRRALQLEDELVKKREEVAQKDLVITAKKLAQEQAIRQSSDETFQQFLDRILTEGVLTDTRVDAIIDKIEALEQARGSSLAFQEKVENSLAIIQEKRNKVLEEQLALLRATQRAQDNINTDTENPLTDAFATQLDNEFDIRQRFNDRVEKAQKEADLERRRREKREADARVELERQVAEAKLNITLGFLDVAGSLFDQQSQEYKAIATFQTLISTYSAAQKAYEAAFLPIPTIASPGLGIAYAALAVAQGLARVAAINGVQFAEGGWTGPGEKYKPVGVVHADEYVTPKWLVHSPKAQPHLNALENMRTRGYADGGLVVNTATQPINQSFEVMNLIKNMPPVVASWSEGRKVGRRLEFKEKISKR
jgi:hypothetical protein